MSGGGVLAFLILSLAACSGRTGGGDPHHGEEDPDGGEVAFHVLGVDGQWIDYDGGPGLPEGEVTLAGDAAGNGMLAGDTVRAVGWNSARDGSGVAPDPENPAAGDWYAQYEVTACTIWFSTEFGDAPDPIEVTALDSWKVEEPDDPEFSFFKFRKWCRDAESAESFDFGGEVRHSTTLYADWETPLCFTALVDGCSVALVKVSSPAAVSLETSFNGVDWVDYEVGDEVPLDEGESVYFAAKESNSYFSTAFAKYYKFNLGDDGSKKVAASGNVMSLYDRTFELKSLGGKNYGFVYLFKDCVSLTSAPELPATSLGAGCYGSMFSGCTSLTKAPTLHVTNGAAGYYNKMFSGCTSLADVTVKFSSWPLDTTNWLSDVSPTGTFHCPEGLDTSTRDADHIPEGWEIVNDV